MRLPVSPFRLAFSTTGWRRQCAQQAGQMVRPCGRTRSSFKQYGIRAAPCPGVAPCALTQVSAPSAFDERGSWHVPAISKRPAWSQLPAVPGPSTAFPTKTEQATFGKCLGARFWRLVPGWSPLRLDIATASSHPPRYFNIADRFQCRASGFAILRAFRKGRLSRRTQGLDFQPANRSRRAHYHQWSCLRSRHERGITNATRIPRSWHFFTNGRSPPAWPPNSHGFATDEHMEDGVCSATRFHTIAGSQRRARGKTSLPR